MKLKIIIEVDEKKVSEEIEVPDGKSKEKERRNFCNRLYRKLKKEILGA